MMLLPRNLKLLPLLLALSATPLLMSCATDSPGVPELASLTPPPRAEIPEPAALCPVAEDLARRCYSDVQNGEILAGLDADIAVRDRMLCWLRVYFQYPACEE